jgi:acetyltransferase-like isoleucine patch superfamily enzyme
MKIEFILRKIFWRYYYLKTFVFYRPFVKKAFGKFLIINPIVFSSKNIEVGKNVFIRNNARIEAIEQREGIKYDPLIQISDNVSIEQNFHLTCGKKITIGSNTAISANVTITDIHHPYTDIDLPPERQPLEIKEVTIGADCKIYNNVVILPGTDLGKHITVGANSVVKGIKYPDYCVIAGAPAKIIKRYNFESKSWENTDSTGNFIK